MLFSADSANISLGMRNALRFLAANYYIMFCGASSSNYCTKKAGVLPSAFVFCSKKSRKPFLFLPSADGRPSADTAARRWRRLYARCECAHWPPSAARESRCSPAGTKGDRTPGMVSCPLLTPLTFLCADTSEMCSETGVTGARFRASVRFWDAVMP